MPKRKKTARRLLRLQRLRLLPLPTLPVLLPRRCRHHEMIRKWPRRHLTKALLLRRLRRLMLQQRQQTHLLLQPQLLLWQLQLFLRNRAPEALRGKATSSCEHGNQTCRL
jgi:hypothetical protein